MNEQEMNRKVAAARLLGLEVEESFTKIDGSYFEKLEIKHKGKVIQTHVLPIPDKDGLVTQIEQAHANLTTSAADLQTKIDAIKALDK
jgi:hypothetical protein